MKKCLISRYGAYGDIIHISHLPHLLKDQGFDVVDVETNWKGFQILQSNPFIDKLKMIEIQPGTSEYVLSKHWDASSEGYDKFINLYKTLEYGVLAMENTNEYYMSSAVRQARYSDLNYYDVGTIEAGYPELCGKYNGEIYYTEEEHTIVKNWINLDKFKDKFIVMLNLSGTSAHKEFVQYKEVADYILEKYSPAHIILTGGKEWSKSSYTNENVTSIVGKFPFRQALLIAKYVNLMITCESGIGVGSAMWGTPTIQMMTAANIVAHAKYAKNDYSIQSPARCSPCHKGPYMYTGCPTKDGKPLCVFFNLSQITEKIDAAYRETYKRTEETSTTLSVL